jgi:hypothetical protein
MGAIIALAAAVYFTFFYAPSVSNKESLRREDMKAKSTSSNRRLELVELQTVSNSLPKAGLKARLLLRIRKQFDLSIRVFLPTLRKTIFDLIDITQPVRQIKALRSSSPSSENQIDMEAQLWDQVKISSFTMLFLSTYVLCGLTTVLKVQLHVLARAILRGEGPALESLGSTPENAEEAAIFSRDSALLRKLIDGTFRHMFGAGLQRLADLIRSRLQVLLRDWVVKDRMKVEFEDILQLINSIRCDFENDFDSFIRGLFYEQVQNISEKEIIASSKRAEFRANRLLRQVRQAMDNPLFLVVYRESVDAAFRLVIDNLRRFVFLSSDSFSANSPQSSTKANVSNNGSHNVDFSPKRNGNGLSSPSASSGSNSSNMSSPTANSAAIARRATQTVSTPVSSASSNTLLRTPSMHSSGMIIVKKTPPLASILPQLKSLSGRLLPDTADAVNPYDLKSLTSGPLLESFCMTIFDAEDLIHAL